MRVSSVKLSVLGSGRGEIAVQDGESFHLVSFLVVGERATFESKYPPIPVPQDVLNFCADFVKASRKFLGV